MLDTGLVAKFREGSQKGWQLHAPLLVSSLITLIMLVFFAAGIFLDERYITGAPAWLKPTKFALSIFVYSLSILWLMSFIDVSKPWRKRLVNVLGWTVALTFAAEWFAIIIQAFRGTTSHFNVGTPFDAALWAIMAVAIMILWIANFVLAGLLLFQRFENPVLAWSLRLGLIITIIGMGLGYLMTSPTAQQLAGWQTGEPISIVGAHSVGVADGGAGLPLVGWSTTGGDLRIGHFVGMHALQMIPFIGFLVARRRWTTKRQVRAIWTVALAYLGFVSLVTWQALRAQPITQPDALTVSVFVGIVLIAGLALLLGPREVRSLTQKLEG